MIRSVTVYCSSSDKLAEVFVDSARDLGRAIAKSGWKLVYGGNDVGNMGTLAGGAREAGGCVIGVTPKLFVESNSADKKCDELIVTDGMRDRKAILEERGDAFIALPGGLGTFEEIFEIICGKQLRYHNKAIVLLNIENYYDPLLAMIDHGEKLKFIRPRAKELYHVAKSVPEAIEYLKDYQPPHAAASSLSFEVKQPPSAAE